MAQAALDVTGAPSEFVGLRMTGEDTRRIDEMAARRKVCRSAVIRELVRQALDQMERGDTRPP
jgi:metal-responsive CopG/Arc/MetJ family transcriptional regulator